MGFSRQEYWSELPFYSLRDLPNQRANPSLLHWQINSLSLGHQIFSSVQFSHSVMSDSCELIDCSTPGFPVHHQLPELAQTHVHILTYTPMVKNLPANARDVRNMGSIPGSGRSPGGEHGNPLQYSCLENPMNRGAWQDAVHRITKSWT